MVRTKRDESPLESLLSHAGETIGFQAKKFTGRADVRYHLAVVHEARGDEDAALDEVSVALSLNPDYAAASDLCERLAA